MKSFALLFSLLSSVALAQLAPTNVVSTQQTGTHADACLTANATGAVNVATTLTLTAPSAGLSIYICEIDLTVSNNATGAVVSTNLSFTTTNLGGWAYKFSAVNTANTTSVDRQFNFMPGCIKAAAAATAVTIVPPAANAQAAYSINTCYLVAP